MSSPRRLRESRSTHSKPHHLKEAGGQLHSSAGLFRGKTKLPIEKGLGGPQGMYERR